MRGWIYPILALIAVLALCIWITLLGVALNHVQIVPTQAP